MPKKNIRFHINPSRFSLEIRVPQALDPFPWAHVPATCAKATRKGKIRETRLSHGLTTQLPVTQTES